MCGLIAIHAKNSLIKYNIDEFKNKLVLNSLRGAHSTGVAGFKGERYNFVKATGSPYALFWHDETAKFFDGATDYHTLIGHGRHATRGEINAYNQHPFREGNIVLAHNGGITNFVTLHDKEKHKHITVDSHLVCAMINELGAEAAIPQLLGAYVLMWYNLEDETFNIARNSQRPLWMATNPAETLMYFSSEKETLEWNAERNNTPIKECVELPVHQIWTFQRGSLEPTIVTYTPKTYYYETTKTSYNLVTSIGNYSPYVKDDLVEFTPMHYKEFKQGTQIWGEDKDGHQVKALLPAGMTIDAIFNNDIMYATAVHCYKIQGEEYAGGWSVWCEDLAVNPPVDSCDIQHMNGYVVHLSKHRLDYLLADGCEWCKRKMSYRDIKGCQMTTWSHKGKSYEGLQCAECIRLSRC